MPKFTFMHLAYAFIQSDLQAIIQAIIYLFFYQYVCSLGIESMTFCAANAMLPLSHITELQKNITELFSIIHNIK